MKSGLFIKISFYLLSMVFLFLIIIILGTDIPVSFDDDAMFIGVWECITRRGVMIPIVCVVLLIYTVCYTFYLKHKIRGTKLGPIIIKNIENVNNDILAFVGTYFFPLVSFGLSEHWQHLVVLCLLFIIIGVIYVRADIYYTNPTLLLLGYRVYRIEGELDGLRIKKIIIIKGELHLEEEIKYIPIDDVTYYAKKM